MLSLIQNFEFTELRKIALMLTYTFFKGIFYSSISKLSSNYLNNTFLDV